MLLRFTAFVFCTLLGLSVTLAQPSDSTDATATKGPEALMASLGDKMTGSQATKETEAAFRAFEQVYGTYTAEEQERILKVCTFLQSKHLQPASHFQPYLSTLALIKTKTADRPAAFNEWHGVLEAQLSDGANYSANKVAEFLRFSKNLYEMNAINYSPESTSWFAFFESGKWSYNQEPLFTAENVTLTAIRLDDTLNIYQTNFVYHPVEMQLEGRGGKADWARTTLGKGVFVTLEKYTVATNQSIYEAQKAYLSFPKYFGNKLLEGTFTDKIVSDESRTSYPRFDSNEKYMDIPNVAPGVRVRGGFSLRGATVNAFGTKAQPAEMVVLNDKNQPRFQGEGNLLVIKDQDRITGQNIEAHVTLGADSLYHPSVDIKLNLADYKLELSRGKEGASRNPFFHSLHQMNIDADYMEAYLWRDSLVIGRATASFVMKEDVVFESIDYFDKLDYDRLQNISGANPLNIMKSTAEREGTRFMPALALARAIDPNFTVENIQPLLFDLIRKGFINYDFDNKVVEMKDKVFHYVDADLQNTDYDKLRITSKAEEANALINLSNGQTLLVAVDNVVLSAERRVGVKPHERQIYLLGDRNLDFDGRLFAGFTTFEGKDFHFEYSPYHVVMDSVRFFDIFIPNGQMDDKGNPVAHRIASTIEKLNGVVLIDAPNNKSGRKEIDIFPSLQSLDLSYVYYDRDSTQNGAYVRDSFYFELIPFSFDKLNRYTEEDVKFKGKLYSSEMFPDIQETVVLREDRSLGFQHKTPAEGYPAYEGRGNYAGELDLSNNGLLGKGTLNYLQATVNAEDFIFMPETATASADAFDLTEDESGEVPVPQVHGEAVKIEWRPYSDSLIVRSEEETPFELYKANDHQLIGTLVLTPDGLRGSGELAWNAATANSEIFSFGAFSADSDTMSIKINTLSEDRRLGLETANVNGKMDFEAGEGIFKANDSTAVTSLPYNQYITNMNDFDWDMNGSIITFHAREGQVAAFTSTHKDQDSLKFEGQEAIYDLNTSLLSIEGVEEIVSADAFIYPDSQRVQIAPNAEMALFENAKIVADTSNRYHVINRAKVEVRGRRVYEASGFYEYNVGPHTQEFELQNIIGQPVGKGALSEKRSVTRATGEIEPSDTFYIDHKTQFRGTISLNAEAEGLKMDGFARITAENLPNPYWFTVSFEGDKNNLRINYDVPKSYDNEPLFTGVFLSKEEARIYPRALAPLLFRKDRPILSVSKGVMDYLPETDQFVFGDSSIVVNKEITGNRMTFNNRDRSVLAEGKFSLGQELLYMSVAAAGTLRTKFGLPLPEQPAPQTSPQDDGNIMLAADPEPAADPDPATEQEVIVTDADWMMGLNMMIPDALMKIVHNDIVSSSFVSKPIGYLADVAFYTKAVQDLFPPSKERDDALSNMALGVLELPQRINTYSFLFSKLPMIWNKDYQSFVSKDKEHGLISLNGQSVNQRVECYVELKMPSAEQDDRLYVYLKSPSGLIYFFGFKEGILSITSNNTVFMQQMEGMKGKDLIVRMPDGNTFEIQPVELSTADTFMRRVVAGQKLN